jgi:membrane-associated protein
VVLAVVIFCETGLVVTPFLPGDSLLFATGALAAKPEAGLEIGILMIVLTACAIAGDAVNYWVGARVGEVLFDGRIPWLRQSHLDRTHAFFERHGGKTIIIARFVPIVRTIAPFVAGAGTMTYRRFFLYNVTGALLWCPIMLLAGFLFGNIPVVKENFGLVIIGIIVVSLLPAVWSALAHRPPTAEERSRRGS